MKYHTNNCPGCHREYPFLGREEWQIRACLFRPFLPMFTRPYGKSEESALMEFPKNEASRLIRNKYGNPSKN